MSISKLAWVVPTAVALTACANEVHRPSGWSEATHGADVAPDYVRLFDADVVHAIEISIAPADYAAMQSDLERLLADSPFRGAMPGGPLPMLGSDAGAAAPFPPGAGPPAPAGDVPAAGGVAPEGINLDGADLDLLSVDPIYVPIELRHDGAIWTQVGMRYKGNSSLTVSGGQGKLPFRLDFDEFEGQHPEVDDQRFYGFNELTFSSNWGDDSQLRECFATELLRDRGVPAARCAFYSVYVDVGSGAQYWGLYSMLEDPSDALIDSQLGGGDGNLYKPDGPGSDWVAFDREGFAKKTNEAAADWSDVERAFAALHADRSDAAVWRRNFEATFDVDRFLSWLAVNTSMDNWDSYGVLAHNYYLYEQPNLGGRLQWIPWDHNLAMQTGGFGDLVRGDRVGLAPRAEVLHEGVGSRWPLISILLADPVYSEAYRAQLAQAIEGLFAAEAAAARLHALHDLVEPYLIGESAETAPQTNLSSVEAFANSVDGVDGLLAHLSKRRDRVRQALSEP